MTSSSKALLPIFLIVAVDILGLTIIFPILPFYAEHFGASPQTVGWIITIFSLCQFFSGPILGRLSDRHGRKKILILSQIGTCAGFIVLALAHQLWVIFLSRFIDGVTAGNLPIAQALISDVTAPKDRAKAFGIIGMSFGIGLFIGPGISAFLSRFGYAAPAWAAALLSLTSIFCTVFLLPKTAKPAATMTKNGDFFGVGLTLRHFRDPALQRLLFQFLFFMLSFSFFISGFALFAERRYQFHGHAFDGQAVGYYYAYLGLFGILLQGLFMGPLVKRFGEWRLATLGFLTQGVGYGWLAFAMGIPSLLASTTMSSFGSGVLRPALTSLVSQNASKNEQGTVLGVTQSIASVAQIIAPLLSGCLIGKGWLSLWALLAGACSLIGVLLSPRGDRGMTLTPSSDVIPK